ncbi:GIY-YIG nuclease family protein [Heliorestis acidaminivorans]|uniref:GIY-YIG nuclease family protein n=1 Tax=Heliorestis acidaminivorans TaxID=553427 RepID=A0A6I0F539_9FIRM|nr:GIY-YIG nuclease family protein [Heliorestis acidaminivorans]KAB2954623.1 GIY-YIG nuclease family protein [Heliorestis acidaminivorans]
MAYTYILHCADGSFYTGWTVDLTKRVERHNDGTGSAYTRARLPVKLIYWEFKETRQEAQRREWEIKQLKRSEKVALINFFTEKLRSQDLEIKS